MSCPNLQHSTFHLSVTVSPKYKKEIKNKNILKSSKEMIYVECANVQVYLHVYKITYIKRKNDNEISI